MVSYGSMTGGNLNAVDRVVTIVRELDRYHGFAPAEQEPTTALGSAPPYSASRWTLPLSRSRRLNIAVGG